MHAGDVGIRIYNIKTKHLIDVEEEYMYIFLAPCS